MRKQDIQQDLQNSFNVFEEKIKNLTQQILEAKKDEYLNLVKTTKTTLTNVRDFVEKKWKDFAHGLIVLEADFTNLKKFNQDPKALAFAEHLMAEIGKKLADLKEHANSLSSAISSCKEAEISLESDNYRAALSDLLIVRTFLETGVKADLNSKINACWNLILSLKGAIDLLRKKVKL